MNKKVDQLQNYYKNLKKQALYKIDKVKQNISNNYLLVIDYDNVELFSLINDLKNTEQSIKFLKELENEDDQED